MRSQPRSQEIIRMFLLLTSASLLVGCQPAATVPLQSTLSPTATLLPSPTPNVQLTSSSAQTTEAQPLCEESGSIRSYTLASELLGEALDFDVYLPPCYDSASGQTYPVIYLLHGQWQNTALWQTIGIQPTADELILSGQRQPFLIVMPYEKYYFRPAENNHYPDALVQELLPWVEDNLAACGQKECRAIGGISRGAAWATRLALQNPDMFSALGAHSMSPFNGDIEELPDWVATIPQDELPRIYLDVGASDPTVKDALAFEQTLNTLGVAHEWHLNSGRHNETYWSEQIANYLSWYTLNWMEE
ncbi:MAG TPA: alpha/beta hydrolase-fold protein [Anaerolineaceae bacterium]|nr:alpha/beta hydrolase-fold protein [Anaerolineaceae bacterium]